VKYEVKVFKGADLTDEIVRFLKTWFYRTVIDFEILYNPENFDLRKVADRHRLTLCLRDGEIVGVMLASLGVSILDPEIILLKQITLTALPKTRAANLLFKDFIDFGRTHADHIICNRTVKTNISERTLERLGFKFLEVQYRLET
jgi:hypothetical protein